MPTDSAPRPADRNDLYESLVNTLILGGYSTTRAKAKLDAALAEERRRVVAQIRGRVNLYQRVIPVPDALAILDEVAEDSR